MKTKILEGKIVTLVRTMIEQGIERIIKVATSAWEYIMHVNNNTNKQANE